MNAERQDGLDLIGALRRHARGENIAFIVPGGPHGAGRQISYRTLYAWVQAYAAGASTRLSGEFSPGEYRFVAIRAGRSVECIALFLGLMAAGFCPCFLEPKAGWPLLAERMRAVGVRLLITDEEGASDALAHQPIRVYTPAALRSSDRAATRPDAAAPAMLLFTSGSTGAPKGIVLSQRNIVNNAAGVIAVTELTAADRLLHVMPLHHTNGINNQIIAPLLQGASIVLADKFRAEQIAARLSAGDITYMTGVPTLYSRLLTWLSAQPRRPDFSALRFLRCGSAPISPRLQREIEAAFGVPLLVSYGLSEATCTSAMNPPRGRKIGTVGRALPGQQIRLFEPGGWREAEEGEICIGGDSLMLGYVGAADGDSPIERGWLRTGDLGRLDADGFLTISGRLKNIIVRGGETISPELIENILLRHPEIKNCCVIGRPCADLGEVPVAFIESRDGGALARRQLDDHLQAFLPPGHTPAEYYFIAGLPENSLGKVDRKKLGALLT